VTIYKIVGLLGVLLAIVAAFVNVPYAEPLLAVAGVVVGLSVAGEHHVRVIVSALALHTVASTAYRERAARLPPSWGTSARWPLAPRC